MSSSNENEAEKERRRKLVEKVMKQKILEDKMKSLIKSSVDMDVDLVVGNDWTFIPEKKMITYCVEGNKSIFDMTLKEVMASILHEIAHANFTQKFKPKHVPSPKFEYGTLFNTMDDIRVEKKLMNKFPGTYDSFRGIANNLQGQLEEEFIQFVPNQINYLLNLRQHQWGFKLYFKNKDVENLFLDTILKIKSVSKLKHVDDLHDFLLKDIWPRYKQLCEERPPQEEQSDNSESNQQNSAPFTVGISIEQEKKEDNDSNGQSNEQGQTGDSNSTSQSSGQNNDPYVQEIKVKLSEAFKDDMFDMYDLLNKLKEPSRNIEKNRGKTIGEEIDEEIKKQEEANNQKERNEAKADIAEIRSKEHQPDFKTYEELYADIEIYIPFFRNKLRSIMEDNKLNRFGGAYTRGKLNNKLLYKFRCKSPRIFSKKIYRMHKNYAVTLLVDESGSMTSDAKHVNAARGAVLLAEVLNDVKIPFEIRGFNGSERLYKAFDKPFNWTVKRNLENIIPSTTAGDNGNTNDGFAINWAADSLRKQDGEKIMIVLCDGQPNPSGRSIPVKDYNRLKHLFSVYSEFNLDTEIAKTKKEMLVVGVGIQSNEVTDHYINNIICDDISTLPRLILGIIKKHIRRG